MVKNHRRKNLSRNGDVTNGFLLNLKGKMLRARDLSRICFYCGEGASDVEHVIPFSLVGECTPKVWSCSECNSIASNSLFETIEEKRAYIQNKLRIRYKRVLNYPDWAVDELEELSYTLRQSVISGMEAKKWIERRLKWSTTLNALLVQKVLEDCATGRDFAQRLAESDSTLLRERKLYFCLDEQGS